MPVYVPTATEVAEALADLQAQMDALKASDASQDERLAALEAEVGVPPDPVDPPAGDEGMVVKLAMPDGSLHFFYEDTATDLGDYIDPDGRFVMSCRRATNSEFPNYRVDFRRLADWCCVVCDYGNGLIAEEPHSLGPHQAIIRDMMTGEEHTIDLPAHYWNARWRWQSGPWPHMRSLNYIEDHNWVPLLDPDVNRGTANPLQVPVYTPMGLAGLTAYMPDTGGRADIGMVTDWQGEWLCVGDEGATPAGVLAQGEAGGTIPWHFRDPNTGALLDLFEDWPLASCYWTGSGNVDPYVYQAHDTGIALDVSHMPAVAWLPWCLTGDPYFLETQQAMANYCFLDVPRSNEWVWQMPGYGQTRAMAWSLRTIAQALAGTPDAVPGWLLPKSTMQLMLDQCVRGLDAIMADPNKQGLHLIDVGLAGNDEGGPAGYYPANCYVKVWQTSFFCQAAAWAAMHFDALRPVAGYIAHNQIARTDGRDWDMTYCSPYSVLVRSHYADDAWFHSWTEAWEHNAPILGVPVVPLANQLKAVGDYEGGTYAGLCALAHARAAGVTEIPEDIDATLEHYAGQMTTLLDSGGGYVTWNNSYSRAR